ncbi:DUF3967 domain-containing protein [Priestia megaterium]|uniref:DUF3967 domain-containing protein n=1 Tax=Priestia megaterium TaxID=1404 RepID=UPI003396634A
MEQSYFGNEVAKVIGIGNSTVRKYAIALEEQGYEFQRGINNSRVFYNKDILMLQRLMTIMNKKSTTLEQAVKLAVSTVEEDIITTPVTDKEHDITVVERLERLEQINVKLVQQLQEQQRMLFERDSKRDEQLTNVIREIQETKRLTAAAQEKRPWWKRLFG